MPKDKSHRQYETIVYDFLLYPQTLFLLQQNTNHMNLPRIPAPKAKLNPKELSHHGDLRVDPYFWMNERDHPDVLAYLEEENNYGQQMCAVFKELEDKLFEEITQRIVQNDESAPYYVNGYWYKTKFEEQKEYPIYVRYQSTLESREEVILDVNKLADGQKYYHIGSMAISPNNQFLAYTEDLQSRRIYSICFKNLVTGETFKQKIPNAGTCLVWTNDSKNVYYVTKDDTLREFRVMLHEFETDFKKDKLIFEESDETFYVSVGKTKDKKYILINSASSLESEYRYIDAQHCSDQVFLFQSRVENLEYYIDHKDQEWFIRTNKIGPNFGMMRCPDQHTEMDYWKNIIPYNESILVEDFELFKDYLVLSERSEGILKIHVHPKNSNPYYITFDEEVYTAVFSVNPELDSINLRIHFSSLKTPPTIYEYHLEDHKLSILRVQKIEGGFDTNEYHTERIYATASDQTLIPISIVYHKTFKKDGAHPLLLYGYGSYGISIDPTFSISRKSLLDRNFAFAIAHIRGGQELGRAWYESGKFLEKKNTFTDFIQCAEFLIAEKYTQSDRLFAYGGSAGGLLMGAIANMRPDLWKGILAVVPFVDVVTTMLDEDIPLTTGEYDEWGNPANEEYYHYLKSYSPYDNVMPQNYPAMFVRTGYHDSQVQYWEPAKWVAKIRTHKTNDTPLIFMCDMNTGHSGASGRFKQYRETAREYAFMLSLLD